jgi:DNA (cytosine-5)-methyltransferase 1
VSLFCGAGGLDAGFADAGFHTVYAVDSMPAAVRTFNHNAGANVAVVCDLLKSRSTTITKAIADLSAKTGVSPRGLLGGPPCQGVSNANNQAGPDDPRNRLFKKYCNIVLRLEEEHGLDFFVFENVPALKRARKNLPLYHKLVGLLGNAFDLHEAILDASKFGVAQTRERLIIVGFAKRLGIKEFSLPTGSGAPTATVRTAIDGLPEPAFFTRGMDTRGFAVHPNHWTMTPKSKKFFADAPTSNDGRSFIRLEWEQQSRTVAYGNREIHVHPSGRRRISIYEAMLLQGFDSRFELTGNLSEQVTQISNAVPPPVAAAVGRAIAAVLPP